MHRLTPWDVGIADRAKLRPGMAVESNNQEGREFVFPMRPWRKVLPIAAIFIFGVTACASRSVTLVQPQTGASAKCSAAGGGIMAGYVENVLEACLSRYQGLGYVALDRLTPEQRADLEQRGLLPKE